MNDYQAEEFFIWAFGDEWYEYLFHGDPLILMQAWNRLHGWDLTLVPDGCIASNFLKMLEVYRVHNEKQERKENAKLPKAKTSNRTSHKKKLDVKVSTRVPVRRMGTNANSNKTKKTRGKVYG